MAKKKRTLGKVKRYRHSLHSGTEIAKGVFLWLLCITIVAALGYFVAPRVLDWGTSHWYTFTEKLPSFGGSNSESDPEVVPTATPSPTEEPTATPAPIKSTTIVDGTWADVSLSALSTPELMATTIDALVAQGVTYVVVPLKDTSGYLHYASNLENASNSVAANVVDAAAIAAAIHDAGMIPVASLATFRDPLAAYQNFDLAIQYQNTEYRWLDNTVDAGGKAWLNPYSEVARAFIGDIIMEVVNLGYHQVVLSQVQFPYQVSASQNFGDVGTATRADALQGAIATWNARFAEEDVILWYEYEYANCVTAYPTTGDVLPSAFGMEHVIVNLPLATAENPEPDVSGLPDVLSAFTNNGSEYVVVATNGTAAFG